jgi:predicted Zn-dependent peptidase
MNTPRYEVTRLENGVTIATAEMPHMESACAGLWALTGSRHEEPKRNGIAHFVEHLLFKGTPGRTAYDISRQIEGIGASLDAFTTEDHTCFYSRGPAETLPAMVDVLVDIYRNATLDPQEIEREREVVLEEISMYRDNPSQHVEDLLAAAAWPGHPLGLPITGTEASVNRIKRGDLFAYHRQRYSGVNTVATVAGKVEHAAVVDLLGPVLESMLPGEAVPFAPVPHHMRQSGPRRLDETRDVEQAHLCIGFHTFGRHDPRRYALKILNVLLGENMSSRLFQLLREESGLCYSVSSDAVTLEDCGLLSLYAGLDVDNVPRALELTAGCLRELIRKPVSQDLLQQALNYSIGQSRIALESSASQMMWIGESLLSYQRIVDPGDSFGRLAKVTAEEVRMVAEEAFRPEVTAIAYIGSEVPEMALDGFLG